MKSWEYRPKPKKHVALCYAKETRQHKGSKEPFSNLESRRRSPESKALESAMEGDEAAVAYLVRAVAKGIKAIHQSEGWRPDLKYSENGLAEAVVYRAISDISQKDLCGLIGAKESHYKFTWEPKLDRVADRTIKSWLEG